MQVLPSDTGQASAEASGAMEGSEDRGTAYQQELAQFFPNALPILGSKHLLDNLLKDVVHAMPSYADYEKTFLRPICSLLCNGWWRERLQVQCFQDTQFCNMFDSFESKISHVDIRWGEIANLVAELYPFKEALTRHWDVRKMMYKKGPTGGDVHREDAGAVRLDIGGWGIQTWGGFVRPHRVVFPAQIGVVRNTISNLFFVCLPNNHESG